MLHNFSAIHTNFSSLVARVNKSYDKLTNIHTSAELVNKKHTCNCTCRIHIYTYTLYIQITYAKSQYTHSYKSICKCYALEQNK